MSTFLKKGNRKHNKTKQFLNGNFTKSPHSEELLIPNDPGCIVDKIYMSDVDSTKLVDRKEVLYISSYNKLPFSIRNQVKEYLETELVLGSCCYNNSTLLSIKIKSIDIVQGWFYHKIDSINTNSSIITEFEQVSSKNINNTELIQSSHGVIFDTKKRIVYFKHSWNKYGDIHFDLTEELGTRFQKTNGEKPSWNNYIKLREYKNNFIHTGLKNNLFWIDLLREQLLNQLTEDIDHTPILNHVELKNGGNKNKSVIVYEDEYQLLL